MPNNQKEFFEEIEMDDDSVVKATMNIGVGEVEINNQFDFYKTISIINGRLQLTETIL